MEPGFLLSYWRPWDENSSFVDSWGNYLRDTSLVEYGAEKLGEKVGEHIKEASFQTIYAIEQNSQRQLEATQKATALIGLKLNQVGSEIGGVNRRLDLALEQQRTGNMLKQDIADLLKIPDFEKERIHAINLGIHFFNNAAKDPDLLKDALEEFLHAETLKKQDFFVLHRIGCIYLYSIELMDIPKARDYFVRAAKYASIETEDDVKILVNKLISSSDPEYSALQNNSAIGLITADSYEKAALAEYLLGNDQDAVQYQKKAVQFLNNPKNNFILSKYLMRAGDKDEGLLYLTEATEQNPAIIEDALCDLDLALEPVTLALAEKINAEVEEELERIVFDSFNDAFYRDLKIDSNSQISELNRVISKIKNQPLGLSLRERCALLADYHLTKSQLPQKIVMRNKNR